MKTQSLKALPASDIEFMSFGVEKKETGVSKRKKRFFDMHHILGKTIQKEHVHYFSLQVNQEGCALLLCMQKDWHEEMWGSGLDSLDLDFILANV